MTAPQAVPTAVLPAVQNTPFGTAPRAPGGSSAPRATVLGLTNTAARAAQSFADGFDELVAKPGLVLQVSGAAVVMGGIALVAEAAASKEHAASVGFAAAGGFFISTGISLASWGTATRRSSR